MKTRASQLVAALVVALPVSAVAQPLFNGTETRITTDLGDQYDPAISGNLIVYTDFRGYDTDIWYHDLATGADVQVTQGRGDQELTDASGGLIAYSDYELADVMVYSTFDGTHTNLTASANAVSINPAIGGPLVAWEDRRDGNTEIYARDLATGEERRITSSPAEVDLKPAVDDGIIVWQACAGTTCDIRVYDWATGTTRALTATPDGDERRPDVSGGKVVYDAVRGGEQDIYFFDLATGEEKRLALTGEQINPNVSGDFVAFEDLIDGGYHIRLWHIPTDTVFDVTTSSAGYQFLNDLDGNRIVYTDDRNGHLDIYMYEFTVTFPPAELTGCAAAEAAGAVPVFDSVFHRTTSFPNVYVVAFTAPLGPGLLCVENGAGGADMVSSATLSLNAQVLLRPGDFKDANDQPLPLIEREALLLPANLITARLTSKPGSALRVRVYATGCRSTAVPALRARLAETAMQQPDPELLAPDDVDGLQHQPLASLDIRRFDEDQPLDEEQAAYGCSQGGPGVWGPALLLLVLFAVMPRPAAQRARSRRRG